MRQRHIAQVDRPQLNRSAQLHNVQRDILQPGFLQFVANEPGGKGRGIERYAQIAGQIRDGADMVLMAMGQHDPQQIGAALYDELQIRKHQISTGQRRIGKRHAEVAHDPFAPATIEVDVHADFTRSAQRQKD